jgi:hypothetical protein
MTTAKIWQQAVTKNRVLHQLPANNAKQQHFGMEKGDQ